MKNKTVCFTGHRNIPKEKREEILCLLRKNVIELIEKGYINFLCGGAFGFDTMAELTVLEMRKIYSHIKLILILPCPEQAQNWSENSKIVYESIKRSAEEVIFVSEKYYDGCMQKRNMYMVNSSSVCICYLTENKGGTFYTVNYAKKSGVDIVDLSRLLSEDKDREGLCYLTEK